jgi:hypothetical protein
MSVAYAGYTVVDNGELARREQAAAEDHYRRVIEEAQAVGASIAAARGAFGLADVEVPAVAKVGRRAGAAELAAAAQATQAAVAAARVAYEAAMATARAEAMTAGSSAVMSGRGLADDAVAEREARRAERAAQAEQTGAPASAAAEAAGVPPSQADERRGQVQRVVARLPAEVPSEALRRIEAAAAKALGAVDDEVAFARERDRVRMLVQTAADADRERRDVVARVERWRAELDGLDGEAVAAVRDRLDHVDPLRPLPSDLGSAVRSAANDARSARDRSFALGALAETLDELGYEVDQGFSTAVSDGGAVVPLPRSNQHGVQVRERDGHVYFNVVRYEDGSTGDAVADRNAESHWCSGYDRLVALARDKGVVLEMPPPAPPGHQPLQHVTAPGDRADRTTTTTAAAADQRRTANRTRERR